MVFITTVTNIKRETWPLPLCGQRHSCGVRRKRHQDNLHRLGERDGEVGWPAEVAWVRFSLRFHEKQSSNIITLLNLSYLANVCLSLHQSTKTIIKQGITIVDISLPMICLLFSQSRIDHAAVVLPSNNIVIVGGRDTDSMKTGEIIANFKSKTLQFWFGIPYKSWLYLWKSPQVENNLT